eukprot:11805381-Alexandrium_andersonii.AAC.1
MPHAACLRSFAWKPRTWGKLLRLTGQPISTTWTWERHDRLEQMHGGRTAGLSETAPGLPGTAD